MLSNYYHPLFLMVSISLGFVTNSIAQKPEIDPELLKPVVNRDVIEKNPSRWFETRDKYNHFPFIRPVTGMTYEEQDLFTIGRSFFSIPWVAAPSATTARDGLGPLFSANTCTSCHGKRNFGTIKNEQGHINRGLAFKTVDLSKYYIFGKTMLPQYTDPVYGSQISINGNSGADFEATPHIEFEYKIATLKDGTKIKLKKPIPSLKDLNYGSLGEKTHLSLRMSPMLAGLGLVEALTDEQILANADPDDNDNNGISGRVNWVYHPYTEKKEVGRFGLKAQASSLAMQASDAALNDMGLISSFFPKENCTKFQIKCLTAPVGRPSPEGLLDLPDLRLKGIAFFVAHLKAPKKQPKDKFVEGRKLFNMLGCTSCHKPNWKTPTGIEFEPYSDFLLHDMGDGLADKRNEFSAQGYEWRTQPLWGLGSKLKAGLALLHDGRADNITEAVLWHDGEAEAMRERFRSLPKEHREKLLEFLENL